MTCPHRNPNNQQCRLVTDELGHQSPNYLCSPHHVEVCGQCRCPFTLNYVSASMIVNTARSLLPPEKYEEVARKFLPIAFSGPECVIDPLKHLGDGVGKELHQVLADWGWEIEPNCPCIRHIIEMNKSGPNWVLDNLNTVAGWLVEEFNRRHPQLSQIPYVHLLTNDLAIRLVKRAVQRYNLRQQPTP